MRSGNVKLQGTVAGCLLSALMFFGCGGGSSSPSAPDKYKTLGNVTVETTLTKDLYVVGENITVSAPLTLQPGTIIKLKTGTGINVTATGSIIADGAVAATPILFTSFMDDTAGNEATGDDTNSDGSATAPAAGDWGVINVAGAGSKFNFCKFHYGGKTDSSALLIHGKSATITNSIFAHNGDLNSINAKPALNAWDATAGTVITGNTFFDNKVPIGINANLSIDDSNQFDNAVAAPANPQPNKFNGINIAGCGSATSTTTWSATKVPFVVGDSVSACKNLVVESSGSLLLRDNVIFKFFPTGNLDVKGSLVADASTGNKIVFTSIKDDSSGGDTNGDGGSTTPAKADWRGIWVRGFGSRFNNAIFTYGGKENNPVLFIEEKSATVKNSTFAHNGDNNSIDALPALNAWSAAIGTVITGNTFYDNFVPLGINVTFNIDDSNSFDNAVASPSNPQPNKYNGINIRGCGNVESNVRWETTKVPLVIGDSVTTCTYLTLIEGSTVTVKNGTILKFFPSGQLTFRTGAIMNTGDALFTSIKDDVHGGDTNGDGSTSSPASGDWKGFFINTTTTNFYIPQNSPSIPQPSNMFYATIN